MITRPATRADYERVRDVLVEWWGGRDLTGLLQPLFFENFASTSTIVEDDDGSIVAFLVCFPSGDDPSCAYVHFLGVDPARRGAGLGRGLHDRFAAAMAERGVTTIRCVTSPVNAESVAFHRHIGFDVDSTDDEYVHLVRTISATAVAGPAGGRFVPRADPRPSDPPWPAVRWPIPAATVLAGRHVELALASAGDAEDLFAALDHDVVWSHVRGRPSTAGELAESLGAAEANGRWAWIVRQEGQVVGTTSFLEVSPVDARLEIGFTLYTPSAWGTVVNPECKLLLMSWAFDEAGFGRVQLKTDIRNARSQSAIARLGARYEGVLRRYQRRQDDSIRDTVLFAVTVEEWPMVRSGLLSRIG